MRLGIYLFNIAVLGILGSCNDAIADQTDFLLLGTNHKAVSGAGLTQLSGYEAVLTNPAAIGSSRVVPMRYNRI